MLTIEVENLGELTVVECKAGSSAREAVFRLRDIVQGQAAARIMRSIFPR